MTLSELCFVPVSWVGFKISYLGPYNSFLCELRIKLNLPESSFKSNKNYLKTPSDGQVMAQFVKCTQSEFYGKFSQI